MEQMFLELVELIGAGWRIELEQTPGAGSLMNVPMNVKFKRSLFAETFDPSQEPRSLPTFSYPINRYQLQSELPRAVHEFYLMAFPIPKDGLGAE